MDNQENNASERDFIPGIYNYCDRWCERCFVTNRCRVFYDIEQEDLMNDSDEPDMDKLKNKVSHDLANAMKLLDKAAEEFGIDLNNFVEEIENNEKYTEEQIKKHPLSVLSLNYSNSIRKWISNAADKIFDNLENAIDPSVIDKQDIAMAEIKDAYEVLMFYQFQIHVKCTRALSGLEKHPEPPDDEFPSDSTGSAHVALMGIERSIKAWKTLKSYITVFETDAIRYIAQLNEIQKLIDAEFPEAQKFKSYFV